MSLVELYKTGKDLLAYFTINLPDWRNDPTEAVTRFDDILGPITGIKLSDVKGTVGFDFDEISLIFEPSGLITEENDCVVFNFQKEHKVKEDSVLRMHLHYTQTDTVERTFLLRYRVQANGGQKTVAWSETIAVTNVANNVFSYVSGSLNQIVQFQTDVDWSDVGISSTVQFKMTRTDANAGNVEVTFTDGHKEVDDRGSTLEYVK